MDIIAAMDNPALFASAFAGPTWDHWRTVLKATYALPMDDDELAFFHSIAGGRDPPKRPVKEACLCVGRGGGKDSIASSNHRLYRGACSIRTGRLRPGERAMIACLACDREQAKIVLNYTRSYFQDSAPLQKLVQRETAHGFELSNGVDVDRRHQQLSLRARPSDIVRHI